MSRGKHADAAVARRLHAAEQRVRALEGELAHVRADARRRELEYEERLRQQGADVAARTTKHVHEVLGDTIDKIANRVSSAVWVAQRVAMTEHLTWLFLKGYVKWDRFEGDREVLKFLSVHGNLHAWFVLIGQYARMHNHDERRRDKREDGVKVMLEVLREIDRSETNAGLYESRKGLDDVVETAREAFIAVELHEILTEKGWVEHEPAADELAMHRAIADSIPEFNRLTELVS